MGEGGAIETVVELLGNGWVEGIECLLVLFLEEEECLLVLCFGDECLLVLEDEELPF